MDNNEIPKKIFFWTLFALFWLVSAIIIGYAFGYRFSFQRGIFVYAGSITLKTTPQDADVYINNILYSSKKLNRINSSYHIDGVSPGEYRLEVKSPGYASWSKNISVHSGVSTEFWNIVLAKNSYEKTAYNTPGAQRFFISPRKNLVATVRQNNEIFSVDVVTAENETVEEIFSSNEYLFTDEVKENIEWTPQAHRVIIPTIRKDSHEKSYFIVDIETKEALNLKDISQAENISHVRWDPETRNALFYISGSDLYRADLDSPSQIVRIAQNIASYELASSGLYYFQLPEGIVYRNSFEGTSTPTQITLSPPSNMDDSSYQLIVYDEDRMVFLNRSNDLFVYNKGDKDAYIKQLSSDALGSQFSDDGKKLLFWTDHEIHAYFVRDWDVQPVRMENEILPITRYSEPISNVQWSRDYEHVIFTTNKKTKIIEIDQRDHRNVMDILSLNYDSTRLVNNNSDGLIYFTDSDNEGTVTLHTIEFPEKTTLLQGFFGPTTADQNQTATN